VFTGIIEETGIVLAAVRRRDVLVARIGARKLLRGLPEGGSIAVNGCCLTAIAKDRRGFTCELTRETLRRTAFGRLRRGARVNLERPLRAGGRFDGHIVQGHVDGVGRVKWLRRSGDAATLAVAIPAGLERYIVLKGSVAVDGVSLTVAGRARGAFTVALIPYTLDHTSLGAVEPGDAVNLEVDVIAKYVERLLAPRSAVGRK
jgi:riboflavin synthase